LPGTVQFSDSTLQFSFTLSAQDQLGDLSAADGRASGSDTDTLVILS
jgi:hypothetical protein